MKFIDLKKENCPVDYALVLVEMEIESAIREGEVVIKVLHGYGSHGRGGAILVALRQMLNVYKKQKRIIDYFGGDRWNIFDKGTLEILNKDKTIYNDEDMGKANPGITIIVLK